MPKTKTIHDTEVLNKALIEISNRGPNDFTLADIAEAVGLAPATLVQRFGSKERLLKEAVKQGNVKLKEDLQEYRAQGLSPSEEIVHLLTNTPDGFGSREDFANSLSLLRLDIIDPEIHLITRERFVILRERLEQLIEAAQQEGSISSTRPTKELAWEIEALHHGLAIQWALSGEGALVEWVRARLRKYLQQL